MNTQTRYLPSVAYRAGAIRDSLGVEARPGVVVVAGGKVVAAGKAGAVSTAGVGRVVELGDRLLLPALVNAHAHLDLTGVGQRAYGGDFVGWLGSVMALSPKGEGEIRGAVERGLALSRQAGVGCVGDIAHTRQAITARVEAGDGGLPGVSFLECFGIGAREAEAVERLKGQVGLLASGREAASGLEASLGIQAHSPYSAGLGVYGAAAELAEARGWRVCTHLAETLEEVEFVRDGRGAFVDLLKGLDRWDETIRPTGLHPVDWLEPVLSRGGWLLVHCNYIEERHVGVLSRCGASVAYCPVASDYFGHHQPGRGVRHRYREMLEAGVNVCLGTDSILCQRADDPQPLGVGSQMRHLYRRDGVDAGTLLKMATVNGAAALGLGGDWATLGAGAPGLLASVRFDPADPADALEQALRGDEPFEGLYGS